MPNVELQARVKEQVAAVKAAKLKYRGVTYIKSGKQTLWGGAIPPLPIGNGPYADTLCRHDGGIDHNTQLNNSKRLEIM